MILLLLQAFTLPDGYTIEAVAAPPLVEHPIMAGIDYRGRLYVCDTSGENLNKKELEEKKPGLIRRLEDTDGDGRYDRSIVFADGLTFPQGALWVGDSLYTASPPGIWKFTDADGDGRPESRRMIVEGFEYTGNAADVHGPFAGPDDRLYWCHGRKGHDVHQNDGALVSKALGARVWSCKADGSDIRVFAGGGMDNPVELAFTPEGEMLGTVALLHSEPRRDGIVHWIPGGVYPRYDQQHVLAEFAHTGEPLIEAVDLGHTAPSGLVRTRAGEWFTAEFNSHRVMRVLLERHGSTFRGRAEPFLTASNPDVHFTDVLEDRDGSLLVVDTGGWFRIGCPTSQVAKPQVKGTIYRVRGPIPPLLNEGPDPLHERRREADRLGVPALLESLARPVDRHLDHALIHALIRLGDPAATAKGLASPNANTRRGALLALEQMKGGALTAEAVLGLLGVDDEPLRDAAAWVLARHPEWAGAVAGALDRPGVLRPALQAFIDQPELQAALAPRLGDPIVLEAVAEAGIEKPPASWTAPVTAALAAPDPAPAIRAASALGARNFAAPLAALAADTKRPARIRMMALLARGGPVDDAAFALLMEQADSEEGPTVESLLAIQALAAAALTASQQVSLTRLVKTAGPIELPTLMEAFLRTKDEEVLKPLAEALAKSPGLGALPAERAVALGVKLVEPRPRLDRSLPPGDAARGRALFFGKATCHLCHRVGKEGGAVGPDLSQIGRIRESRDLLEAILLPSASFVRGYEPMMVAMKDGSTYTGRLGAETQRRVELVDSQGARHHLRRDAIFQLTASRVSVMPEGLDRILSDAELADVVSYLRGLK